MDVSYGGSFLAGLLSFLSPCVLPLVPPYLCFLAGTTFQALEHQGDDTDRAALARVRWTALAFVLGFSTVFVSMGATASAVGQLIAEYHPVLAKIAGVIIILLGLQFLGVFRIGFLQRDARFDGPKKPMGVVGAYVVGLAFAFGWTPCVGPVLAAILMVAATGDGPWSGAGLLAVYSAGIGLPFLGAAFAVGPFLGFMKRFRRHLGVVEKVMGLLLIATGILFVTGSVPEIANWMLDTFPSLGKVG